MDLSKIYSRTTKGARTVSSKSKSLSSQSMRVLSLIDGKSTLESILADGGKLTQLKLDEIITQLSNEGYIKDTSEDSLLSPTQFEIHTPIEVAEISAEEFLTIVTEEEEDEDTKKERKLKEAEVRAKAYAEEQIRLRDAAHDQKKTEQLMLETVDLLAKSIAPDDTDKQATKEKIPTPVETKDITTPETNVNDDAMAAEHLRIEAAIKAEIQALAEAERMTRQETETQAKQQAEERAKQEAEEKARMAVETKAREEAARVARAEAEALRRTEEKAREEAEARARREAEELARIAAEIKAQEEAARAEAEALRRAEEKARLEAERKAKEEAEARARREAEKRARLEAEEKARIAAEIKAQEEAARIARAEAEALRKAEEKARLEAERKAREEAKAQAKAEARAKAKAEAERKAREAAEARAKRDAEEKIRLETKRQAREAAKARAKAEAEAKARDEAERRALKQAEAAKKAEAQLEAQLVARERAQAAAEEKARNKESRVPVDIYKSLKPVIFVARTSLITLSAITLLLLIIIQFINLHMLINPIQALVSESVQEPVTIEGVHASLWPQPHLTLTDVSIGKSVAVKASTINVSPVLSSVFSPIKILKSIEIEALVLDQESISRPAQWIVSSNKLGKLKVSQIYLNKASIKIRNFDLPPFNADIKLDDAGNFTNATISNDDRHLTVLVTPANDGYEFNLTASDWQAPLGPSVVFDELSAHGTANHGQANLSEVKGELYNGTIRVRMNINWGSLWNTTGSFQLTKINLDKITPIFSDQALLNGRLNASGTFSMRANSLPGLFATPEINASFEADDGHIGRIDLVRAMQVGGKGTAGDRSTRFDRLSGNLLLKDGHYQFRQLSLRAGQFNATGGIDIQGNQSISGRVHSELAMKSRQIQSDSSLSGTVGTPSLN